MAREPDVGARELEVLKVLWDCGPSTARDVLEQLAARGRELAYNTVQTVLGRLAEKGFVRRDERVRPSTYRAGITRDKLSRKRLKDLLFGVHDGMAGTMVMQLVRSGKLREDEIDELQSMLDRLAQKKK